MKRALAPQTSPWAWWARWWAGSSFVSSAA